jgi:phenylalanyl-tRNA synthetase beta chain
MKIPLSWLKEFVDIDLMPEEIAERLTVSGLEVAHIRYIGVPQTVLAHIPQPKSDHLVWDREKLLLGAIREVKKHPDADKLVLAMVDYGAEQLEQVVTGAPNLFPYVGKGELNPPLWSPFALEGAVVYDGHSEERKLMTLKGKPLRGIFNRCMVCSEKELGISEEHEGILILDHDERYKPGTPLQDVLGDVVFEIELTPNLGHCTSVLGVARELAALTNKPLRQPSLKVQATGAPIEGQAFVEIHNAALNPRFTLTLLKNTRVQPSPFWVQYRLRLIGQRPINNIVDATNYVTFELGQPLHAFDYDVLTARNGGKPPTLITRTPHAGETLTTLDGVTRELGENQVLVCDTAGVLSLAGIMGGAESEISASTTNVLLEAASWNFINIRKTTQAQKLFTEASTRFSRNLHPSRAGMGCLRGIELMRQWGGGEVAQGMVDNYPAPPAPVHIALPIREVYRLLGIELTVQQAADYLSRLAFDVTIQDDTLHVVAPDYRTDISEGVVGQADLIEEIARVIGYDNLPTGLIDDVMPAQHSNPKFEAEERVRDICVALGLTENITYRMTTPEAEALLVPHGAQASFSTENYVTLANPISPDKTVMRHTLLVSLLEQAVRNNRFSPRQQVFEVGNVYLKREGQLLPDEPLRLAILMMGARHEGDWSHAESTDNVDFYDLKGVVQALFESLHVEGVSYQRGTHTSFHPKRSADVVVRGNVVGTFGELHPLVAEAFKLTSAPVIAAEFDLERILRYLPARHEVQSLPLTPPILEDLAVVVADDLPASDVEALIRRVGGKLLKGVRLFDVYKGAPLPEGTKSLAYALTYQADDKTLKDEEVAKIRTKIIHALENQLNAKLRA